MIGYRCYVSEEKILTDTLMCKADALQQQKNDVVRSEEDTAGFWCKGGDLR